MDSKMQGLCALCLLVYLTTCNIVANEICPNKTACQFNQSLSQLQCYSSTGLAVSTVPTCVHSINLIDLGLETLRNYIPSQILQVNELILNSNNFTGIPSHLQTLKVTQILDISRNKIATIKVSSFQFLKDILTLNLSNNVIHSLENESFHEMFNLEKLDLSGNMIQHILSGLFVNCNKLQTLILANNLITNINVDTFAGLHVSMVYLDLSNNQLSQIPSATFLDLQDLRSLKLSYNQHLDTVDLDFPFHIKDLVFRACSIQQVNECKFSQLLDLTLLDLSENDLSCDCHVTWLYEQYIKMKKLNSVEIPYNHSVTPWDCKNISDTKDHSCFDHQDLPHHCVKAFRSSMGLVTEQELTMKVDQQDGAVEISWLYNTSLEVYGFKVSISSDKTDIGLVYESPILHSDVRNVKYRQELDAGHFTVCVLLYRNSSFVSEEKCEAISIGDMKIVIGILAGTVFLVPCLIGLIYIVYKDKKIASYSYQPLLLKDKTKESSSNQTSTQPTKNIKVSESRQDLLQRHHDSVTISQTNQGFIQDKIDIELPDMETDDETDFTSTKEHTCNRNQSEGLELKVDIDLANQYRITNVEHASSHTGATKGESVYCIKL